jgi:hypothetical protein
MQVPYTTSTGIQIGIRYIERSKVAELNDPDMLRLQEALLATPDYISTRRLNNIVMCISTAVFVGVLVIAISLN